MKWIYKILTVVMFVVIPQIGFGQCAMCRTQVVNNVSHGDTSLAAGLNLGIMYLFFAPYLILGVMAYLWHKKAKVRDNRPSVMERIKAQK